MDTLTAIDGPHEGATFTLGASQIIGRLGANEIPLPDDTGTSRRHVRITRKGTRYLVVDLQSSNGTRLNGEGIERAELKDGDVLLVGNTRFRARISGVAEAAPAGTAAAPGGTRPQTGGSPRPQTGPSAAERGQVGVRESAKTRVLRSKADEGKPRGFFALDVGQLAGPALWIVSALALAFIAGLAYLCYAMVAG